MPKLQFWINYVGNKYQESKHIDQLNIDWDKYDTIVEPFGGTFGFSRWLWDKKDMKSKKYVVYDTDEKLINFYKTIQQKLNDGTYDEFMKSFNDLKEPTEALPRNPQGAIKSKGRCELLNTLDEPLKTMYYYNVVLDRCIRDFRQKQILGYEPMMEQVNFIRGGFTQIKWEDYDMSRTFVYLDPPYLDSFNTNYKGEDEDYNAVVGRILSLFHEKKTNVMLVHCENALLDHILKPHIACSYGKTYGFTKRQADHKVYYSEKS
jgi:site-specific DNA-adenine methylase